MDNARRTNVVVFLQRRCNSPQILLGLLCRVMVLQLQLHQLLFYPLKGRGRPLQSLIGVSLLIDIDTYRELPAWNSCPPVPGSARRRASRKLRRS
jgi:hypothetical protein